MSLEHTRSTYEQLGRDDPFYAVLTAEKFRNNKWDVAEFFATGEAEVSSMLAYVDEQGLTPNRARALDFGCGVGRLTQALADRFDRVAGVDIAESMAAKARELNRHGDRVEYFANAVDNLGLFEDHSFDFIYSSISLQHIPPDANRRYVAEFMRLLRPGGIAVFQVPNGKEVVPGSLSAWLYRLQRQTLRRWWKSLRGKPPYEMHYIPRAVIERIVREGGARLAHVSPHGNGPVGSNFRYCVVKAG